MSERHLKPSAEFVCAAWDAAAKQDEIADIGRETESCQECSPSDWSTGDGGVPECRYSETEREEWCRPCRKNVSRRARRAVAKRGRKAARARMMRCYRREA